MSEVPVSDLAVAWKLTWFGMLVVFVALTLVAGAVSLFRFLEQSRSGPGGRVDEPAPGGAPAVEAGIPPEVVAAISAAVCASLGARTRVHRIRYRRGSPEATWSRQGRISIMASHRIR